MEPFDEVQLTNAAWAFLRSNTTATLKFGEHMRDVSYVIVPDGRLVISAMVAMLQSCDTVLFVPEYIDDCMELQVTLSQFEASGECGLFCDRWEVYHGTPPDVQWAAVEIDAAKFHEMYVDGEGLQRENPLASDESGICRLLNAEFRDDVKRACVMHSNVDVLDPIVVGVDSLGIDVRASFGIVRVCADNPLKSPDDVIGFVSSDLTDLG